MGYCFVGWDDRILLLINYKKWRKVLEYVGYFKNFGEKENWIK